MPAPIRVGDTVRLKPARADAYGFPRGTTYKVVELFTKPRYVKVWARLQGGTLEAPVNVVGVNEVRHSV